MDGITYGSTPAKKDQAIESLKRELQATKQKLEAMKALYEAAKEMYEVKCEAAIAYMQGGQVLIKETVAGMQELVYGSA